MQDEAIAEGRQNKSVRYLLWGLFWSLLVVPLVWAFWFSPKDAFAEKKLEELRRTAAETPVYPGFTRLHSGELAKSSGAIISITYRVSAGASESEGVESFYTRELGLRGWGSPTEERDRAWGGAERRALIFRKGEYSIVVRPTQRAAEYNVNFMWK